MRPILSLCLVNWKGRTQQSLHTPPSLALPPFQREGRGSACCLREDAWGWGQGPISSADAPPSLLPSPHRNHRRPRARLLRRGHGLLRGIKGLARVHEDEERWWLRGAVGVYLFKGRAVAEGVRVRGEVETFSPRLPGWSGGEKMDRQREGWPGAGRPTRRTVTGRRGALRTRARRRPGRPGATQTSIRRRPPAGAWGTGRRGQGGRTGGLASPLFETAASASRARPQTDP
jgi:hypothetical protein